MPIFDYRCSDCGHVWEVVLLSGTKEPRRCPNCDGDRVEKAPSAPYVAKGLHRQEGHTCCGREERCDKPPCSSGGGCRRG